VSELQQKTVYIVDDDAGVRDSITELVESVGLHAESHTSAQAFLDAVQPPGYGCLVLDVRMAGMSGLVLLEKLNDLGFSIPAIILTGHADVPMAVQAMRNGAIDLIQKPYRDQVLLDSINNALTLDVGTKKSTMGNSIHEDDIAPLTAREREIYDKLVAGATSKQIARELGISHRTVETHRQNLLRKLAVNSVKALIVRRIAQIKGP
jgi:FixJ family two-component response regulator